jgi:hypothetical protein
MLFKVWISGFGHTGDISRLLQREREREVEKEKTRETWSNDKIILGWSGSTLTQGFDEQTNVSGQQHQDRLPGSTVGMMTTLARGHPPALLLDLF